MQSANYLYNKDQHKGEQQCQNFKQKKNLFEFRQQLVDVELFIQQKTSIKQTKLSGTIHVTDAKTETTKNCVTEKPPQGHF